LEKIKKSVLAYGRLEVPSNRYTWVIAIGLSSNGEKENEGITILIQYCKFSESILEILGR
jgi:hypothetical protein